MFQREYINSLFLRQYIKIQNTNNIDKSKEFLELEIKRGNIRGNTV